MSARPPPFELLQSGWLPYIQNFVARVLRSVPPGTAPGLSSWWRSFALNARIGGSEESQHLFGIAVDVTGPRDLLGYIEHLAEHNGLIGVQESAHLHLQLFPAGALAQAGVRFPTRS